MQTFNPYANDGFNLPSSRVHTPPADFAFAEATGFILYWNDNNTHRFGFHRNPNDTLRFFGGTASPNSPIPGYLQSLMWMKEKGYDLPPSAVLGLRILHRLHFHAPLLPDPTLKPIPQIESHGLIPVNHRFAENFPQTVWLSLHRGGLIASQFGMQWANEGVGHIANRIIRTVTQAKGDVDTLVPDNEAYDRNVFGTTPVDLNASFDHL